MIVVKHIILGTTIGASPINTCSNLTNFGGFENLGKAFKSNYSIYMSSCTLLTHDSLMNVINNLYDINLNSNINNEICFLSIGSTNIAKLTEEEIAIATEKKWTVS